MIELARFADRPAIERADGSVVTYAELDALVEGYATASLVEVPAERTVEFIARCLGAWRGGGAFAPVDRSDPRPRPQLPHVDGLAYVIATSGSTGAPKHVMVGHGGIAALLRTQIDAFALGPGARALWLHAPMFDASISDWGTALASGATLVIPTTNAVVDVRREIEARGITHVDLPPSLLAQLADPPPAGLQILVLGGEACDVVRVRTLARRLRVVVVYGPTEATVCSSLVVVEHDRWGRALIGHPLPGVTYVVRDGELYIGGAALALGYANDPDETARRFVDVDGTRMYRTGDRVEHTLEGLAFIGRVDRQCKIAGRRVELDEIESAIRRLAGGDAAVLVRGERIVAFAERPVERAALRSLLPAWMVPARIVVGPLPRTVTGKLDRAALLVPPVVLDIADPREHALARAWCDALGVDGVCRTDRFGDCGGDSLARLMLHVATDLAIEGDPTFGELVARAASSSTMTVAELERDALARVELSAGSALLPVRGQAVLVTGATGLLGRHLVPVWRRRSHGKIIILARDPFAALDGVRDLDGIEIVQGDVAEPYLGLDPAAWRELVSRLSTIVHCAATIALGADYAHHTPANVQGTIEMARIRSHGLAEGRSIAWHHISTLSVFVSTSAARGRHDETSNPSPDAIVYGGYAQSKVAAEAIARASHATTIFRLGLLVDTAPRPRDQLQMTIRALAKLGAVPTGFRDARFDVTPVAYAAEAIAALARRAEAPTTRHLAAARGMTCGELVDALARAGHPVVELPHPVWLERARGSSADPDIAMAIGAFSGRRDLDLFLATDADFAVERTAAELAALGVVMPAIDVVAAALEGMR